MAHITIIGGAGFIGSELIRCLASTHKVVSLDKKYKDKNTETEKFVDVTDLESLRTAIGQTDVIILLAAEHTDNVSPISLYYDVNVQGAKNVLAVMEEKGIKRLIFTSSVAVYGLNKVNPNEESPVDPFNHYGKSKWEAEEVMRLWYNGDAEKALTIIRPTVVFGEGNRGNVYNLLKQIKSGKFFMVGNGENKKSMSYVKNITDFIRFLLEKEIKGYEVFNYADKPDLTTNELTELIYTKIKNKSKPIRIPYFIGYMGGLTLDIIAKLTGKKFPISRVRIEKFCATTQFSAEKVSNLGFKAPYSLKAGLENTIESIS
ncbi:NAD(P)-dependent oxidoreductase [Chitinophaga sp. CB10]|uniref:NAD-dependent epimerase/dehydratase family protein n=1 Tax=Chitinophaga sp. CB10 TaxID=1891659 RepID=UPI000A6AE129|nr:NAD-dependent epimerase/dehydratase family protein [Chitinophaga sp. CB10]